MQRNACIFLLLALASIMLLFLKATKFPVLQKQSKESGFLPLSAFETKAIHLGKTSFTVFIADTPQKRAQGLMQVRELPANRGMLFIFGKPQMLSFYNRNTRIPLDLVWMKNGMVEKTSFLPASSGSDIRFSNLTQPVDSVLELNAGSVKRGNINIGDVLKFR